MSIPSDPPRLRRARRLAYVLDDAVRLPGGFRVGLDPALSLLPVVGDVAGAVLSSYIVWLAWRAGVPRRTLARMALHVVLESLLGVVPVLGTVADAVVRVNDRNVALFERAVRRRVSRSRP